VQVRAGQVIAGRYHLEAHAGSGGNGVVWRATDEQLGRPVALKRALSGELSRYAEQFDQLRREARLLAQLNHRHVVTLYDVVDDGDECWLVMEYVPARTLADRGVLPPDLVARLGAQIGDALAAMHAKDIVHRDVKPGNILMISDYEAKLSDFGISRVIAGEETVSLSALIAGTPGYVAPEVVNGGDPTAASDVFSLGSTLFAAIEGTSPVGSKTDNAFLRLRRAADGHIAAPRNGGPLTSLLTQLLQVDPAKRPTACEARDMLAEFSESGISQVVPRPRTAWRPRRVLTAVAALVVVSATIAWFALTGPSSAEPELYTGSIMGDPHTADPCKLIDKAPLQRFGNPNLVFDENLLAQCNMVVKVDEFTRESDVTVMLATSPASITSAPLAENRGTFSVVREPPGDGYCGRRLLLPDHYEIKINALRVTVPDADVCGMADTVTEYAAAMVSKGPIPRRNQPDPRSLRKLDACAPRHSPLFPQLPGVDPAKPEVGFASWRCTWTGTSAVLRIEFAYRVPWTEREGTKTTVAGRDALVGIPTGEKPDTCVVHVFNLAYTDSYGISKIEVVYAEVISTEMSQQERCTHAVQLANAVFAPR
jgi:serine/threonine protein kinase